MGRDPPILVLPPDDTIENGEGLYSALPLFHNSGRAAFNFTLVRGARLIMRDKFSATHVWDDVRRCDAKVLALVGPLTSLVYSAPERDDDADNPVRTVVCGPMIPEIEEFEKRFGVSVLTCYGQSESGIALATGWDHGPWDNCGRPRLDYPWSEVRVVNDMDEPVGPGVVGELVVRSAEPWALNVGYYKMPAQTAEAWRNGWFHTGDAFRYDDGRLVLLRRPHERHDPPARREHLVLRGRGHGQRASRRCRMRRHRGADGPWGRRMPRPCPGQRPFRLRPGRTAPLSRPAHAPLHGAALRRGGRRRSPAERDIDAGEEIGLARARPFGSSWDRENPVTS